MEVQDFSEELKHASFASDTAATSPGRCASQRSTAQIQHGKVSQWHNICMLSRSWSLLRLLPLLSGGQVTDPTAVAPGRTGERFRWGSKARLH